MITVEKVVEDNKKAASGVAKENEELLTKGVAKKKPNYLPWILLAAIAIGITAYWLYKNRKQGGTNSGVSGQNV